MTDLRPPATSALAVAACVLAGCGSSTAQSGKDRPISRAEWARVAAFGTKRSTVEQALGPPFKTTHRGTVPISRVCLLYRADRSLGPPVSHVSLCFDRSDRLVERATPSGNEE